MGGRTETMKEEKTNTEFDPEHPDYRVLIRQGIENQKAREKAKNHPRG